MTIKDRTPIPRYQPFAGPALFAHGFRPFFLAAGLWAPLALLLFLGMLQDARFLPSISGPVAWHHHEMLFGFVAAAVAGFSLTAIPNWTGRLPLQGAPLIVLAALWLVGRFAMLSTPLLGLWLAAAGDLLFLAALLGFIAREIVAGRNWRNLPIVVAVALFLAANALSHAETAGLVPWSGVAQRLAIAVIVTLITLIGGRIIPSFTRNWLVKQQVTALPAPFGIFDRAAVAVTFAALIVWAVSPFGLAAALLLGAAATLNMARLARWQGHRTAREALLWALHLAYAWIPVGLALLSAGYWLPSLSSTGALHALTAGAMATMVLAVMSRATLGHTGRPLIAGAALMWAYRLIVAAAVLRVAATLVPAPYMALLYASALAWVMAFLLFVWVCGPMLLRHRVDGPAAS